MDPRRWILLFTALVLSVQFAVGDEVTRAVQEQLRAHGFYSGPGDGNPSSEFSAALRNYQIRHGLPVTGKVDDATAKALDDENESVRRSKTNAPNQTATPPVPEPSHANTVPSPNPGGTSAAPRSAPTASAATPVPVP